MGAFEVGLNAFFFLHYDMATSLWGPGSIMWFERKWPPEGVALLEVALLEEVYHCGGRL